MHLFHGSNTFNLHTLVPRLADHDRPYIYLSESQVVAGFYLANGVTRPYYWFPYGFTDNKIPQYHELYPNALQEVSEGLSGVIYEVDPPGPILQPFKNIPGAWLGIEPIPVISKIIIQDCYQWFMTMEIQGKLVISRFEEKTKKELDGWYDMIFTFIREKDMIRTPECSYALFVKEKFPWVWEQYENA